MVSQEVKQLSLAYGRAIRLRGSHYDVITTSLDHVFVIVQSQEQAARNRHVHVCYPSSLVGLYHPLNLLPFL